MIYNDNFFLMSLLAAKIIQVLTKSTLMDYSQYICNVAQPAFQPDNTTSVMIYGPV